MKIYSRTTLNGAPCGPFDGLCIPSETLHNRCSVNASWANNSAHAHKAGMASLNGIQDTRWKYLTCFNRLYFLFSLCACLPPSLSSSFLFPSCHFYFDHPFPASCLSSVLPSFFSSSFPFFFLLFRFFLFLLHVFLWSFACNLPTGLQNSDESHGMPLEITGAQAVGRLAGWTAHSHG